MQYGTVLNWSLCVKVSYSNHVNAVRYCCNLGSLLVCIKPVDPGSSVGTS